MVQDGDLHEMYKFYNKRREILLWCVRPSASCGTNHPGSDSRKRNSSAGPSEASQPPKVRRTTCSQKIKDVEGIMEQLKEKHGQRYTTEQLSSGQWSQDNSCARRWYIILQRKSIAYAFLLPGSADHDMLFF